MELDRHRAGTAEVGQVAVKGCSGDTDIGSGLGGHGRRVADNINRAVLGGAGKIVAVLVSEALDSDCQIAGCTDRTNSKEVQVDEYGISGDAG